MSAFDSAIDDSFDPKRQPVEDEDSNDDNLFDNTHSGPRDGHWDVSSTVGSSVDDRCPTIYGYGPRPRTAGRGNRIDDGLAKKLVQATMEEKRAAAITPATKNAAPGRAASDKAQSSSAAPSAKEHNPFVVPPLRHKSYNPTLSDRKDSKEESAHQTRKTDRASGATAMREVAAPVAETPEVTPHTAQTFNPNKRTIRILGKNGEEAFVQMPSLPRMTTEPSAQVAHASPSRTQQPSEPALSSKRWGISPGSIQPRDIASANKPAQNENQNQKQNQYQNKNQNQEQKQNRNQNQSQKQNHKRQAAAELPRVEPEQSERAPSFVMTGALPASSRKSSQASQSAANSCKDSGIAMSGMFDNTSKTGSGKASSGKASSGRTGSAISREVLSIAQQIANIPSTTSKKSSKESAAPSSKLFEEVGMGLTTGFPVKQVPSGQSDHSNHTQAHHQSSSRQGSQPSAKTAIDSARLPREDSRQDSRQGTARSNYKPPTVQSGSSSASIVYNFGGTNQDGFVPQSEAPHPRQERAPAPDKYRQAQSGGGRSDRGNTGQSGVKYVSDAARSYQRRRVSPGFPISPCSSGSGNLCPSHSPVSPLTPFERASVFGRQQTNFAGDGWISPHPLSVASTDVGALPQPAVYISTASSGHRGTLTYDEWKAQRDAVGSVAGSYAGSHVPSAVGLQAMPPAVYNHPPPASYVGSYHPITRQSQHHHPQAGSNQAWMSQPQVPLRGSNATHHPVFVQDQQYSSHSQSSAHSQVQSVSTAYNNSLYNGSVHHTPSVHAQNAGMGVPPQYDGSGFNLTPAYNVGLTPAELANYQSRLSNTVSRHSSQFSHVQQEQAPPQPNYEAWNSGQSHASGRFSAHQSARSPSPNFSYPRATTQMAMPWDQNASQAGSVAAMSNAPPSHHAGSGRSGSRIPSEGGRHQSSVASHSAFNAPNSQVTYGTAEWQNLENAEEGHDGFESRQSYRIW